MLGEGGAQACAEYSLLKVVGNQLVALRGVALEILCDERTPPKAGLNKACIG